MTPPLADHEHEFGPFRAARFGGGPVRDCIVPFCRVISLDGDGCDCGSRECDECAEWYAEHDPR